ncbi:MAG: hypothetical protein M3R27_12645 [Bacteroidota bacterium]|nr:hypothetical protein [Bacteroidota bacterium]
MKRLLTIFSILTLLAGFSGFVSVKESCSVKYNGIYAYKIDGEHSAVIRFYEDGSVLSSTSLNDYMDVFTWFHKENKEMVLQGKYKVKKCTIKFKVEGVTGKQEYEGTVNDKEIQVKLTDPETGKSTSRTYTFFAL